MNKIKLACIAACLTLCLAILGGLINQQVATAQTDGEAVTEERIELGTKYAVLSGPSDTAFQFEVELNYKGGDKDRNFDLMVKGPSGWLTQIKESAYGEKEIPSIRLEPNKAYPETLTVVAVAPFWLYPEPGDYTITFEAAGDKTGLPKNSLELTARITARYGFLAEAKEGRLNTKATAGKESYFPLVITNTGTTILDKITFSSFKPDGWSITFKPEKIEALSPGTQEEIEVTIKPPSNTIAGDYMTTLRFNSEPEPSDEPPELDIRVTVTTPSKWGWIGVGIVIAVIAGLVVTFTRLGRR